MNDYIICVRDIVQGNYFKKGKESSKRFGDDPSEETYFLTVPKDEDIDVGFIEKCSMSWFRNVRDDIETIEDEEGVNQGDILIYIHGYNNDQEKLIKRHRQLKKSLKKNGFKGVVVSFDWPSEGDPFKYREDREDASAPFILDGLRELTLFEKWSPCYNIKVHLLAHSTGAYVVKEAFKDMNKFWNINQIIFIGADISSASEEPFAFYKHCDSVTNYHSSHDWALTFSEILQWFSDLISFDDDSQRAGKDGLDINSSPKIVNIDCSDYYDNNYNLEKQNQRIDADNEIIGSMSHSWYVGDELFTKDMYLTIINSNNYFFKQTRKKTSAKQKYILSKFSYDYPQE